MSTLNKFIWSLFWVDVLVYVELDGNIELFSGLESDIYLRTNETNESEITVNKFKYS